MPLNMAKVIKFKNNTHLYGTIIEKGSNSNGKFIKFSDGTAICRGNMNISTSAVNTFYSNEKDFPIEFSDNNIYIGLGIRESRDKRISLSYTVTKSALTLYYSAANLIGTSTVTYIAIGEWK